MKQLKSLQYLLTLALLAAGIPGCSTPNVNPPHARANTGYVDFYADAPEELNWDVARFDDQTQSFKSVFSELEPVPNGVLRLAFAPGHHRLRVTFLNRVIDRPAEVEVEVLDGKITPVRLTLTAGGTVNVDTKKESSGPTAKGSFGRRTKFGTDESVMYSLSATAEPPVAYQLKERMSYAH